MNAKKLLSLALTVDKYFLQRAMTFAGDTLLKTNTTQDTQTIMDLLYAALLLQNDERQQEYTKMLVSHHVGDYALLMRSDTPQRLLFENAVEKREEDWKAFSDARRDSEEERIEFKKKDIVWACANSVSTVCISNEEVCAY